MLPLVLNLVVVGLIVYNSVVMFKLAGELLVTGNLNDEPVLAITMSVIGIG